MYPCTIVCIYAYACRHAFDQGGRAALSRRPRIHPVGEHFFKEISQRDLLCAFACAVLASNPIVMETGARER